MQHNQAVDQKIYYKRDMELQQQLASHLQWHKVHVNIAPSIAHKQMSICPAME